MNLTISLLNNDTLDDTKISLLSQQIFTIIYLYTTPIVCIFGFILSMLTLIVLLNPNLKGNMYIYLLAKTLFETVLLGVGMLIPYGYCYDCSFHMSFGSKFYSLHIHTFLQNVLYFASAITEMFIVLDRYLILSQKGKLFRKESFAKTTICIISSIGILLFLPISFSAEIHKISNDTYDLHVTEFGKSAAFSFTMSFINLTENVLVWLILIVLNILVLYEYKKYIRKKKAMLNYKPQNLLRKDSKNEINDDKQIVSVDILHPIKKKNKNLLRSTKGDANTKFTQMILVSSTLYIVAKLGELIAGLLSHIFDIGANLSFLIPIFADFLTYFICSLSFFNYYYYNKMFRKYFKNLFLKYI